MLLTLKLVFELLILLIVIVYQQFLQIFVSCFEYFDPCHVRSVLAINLFSNYIFILMKYIDSYIRCFFAINNNFKYFLKIDE